MANWPIIGFGILLVFSSLVMVPWPPHSSEGQGLSVSYYERLTHQGLKVVDDGPGSAVARSAQRLFDVLLIVLPFLTVVFLVRVPYLTVVRQAAIVLLLGVLGELVSISAGLQPGPIVSTTGFMFVISGAGATWASHLGDD